MSLRVFIVDDEPLARGKLRKLLSEEKGVEIIGEAGDGRTALEGIQESRPDLVFLDVQMPELDGFGVLNALPPKQRPAVVFVTAHDHFALRAFEVNALDYLLKPFDRARFQKALEKVRSQLSAPQGQEDIQAQLSQLLNGLKPSSGVPERLAVKSDGRTLFVEIAEIDWVEAADNYVKLHTGSKEILMRETMKSLEERLEKLGFIRISRSAIIHPRAVQDLEPLFHGDQSVRLKDGTRLTLSRTRRDALEKLLGNS